MQEGRYASDHRWAASEPMVMPGGIGLDGTPGGVVGIPVAPICPPYGPTPPVHGAHTREKTTHPGENFYFLSACLELRTSLGTKNKGSIGGVFVSELAK